MAIFDNLSHTVLTTPESVQAGLSTIGLSLTNGLLLLENSESVVKIQSEDIEKLVTLTIRLPDLLKTESSDLTALLNTLLDLLDAMLERPQSELHESLYRKLVTAFGPIVLDIFLRKKVNNSHFVRRLAETFSVLVGSVCDRIASSKLRLLQQLHFLLTDDKPCFFLGKFIGECGNFLVQANLVEALVKLIRKLIQLKLMSKSKIVLSRICNGILDHQSIDTSQVVHLSTLLMSVVKSMETSPDIIVQKIRSWINLANDIRAKCFISTVISFHSKKLLLEKNDMHCPVWVDFNSSEITITGVICKHFGSGTFLFRNQCELDGDNTNSSPVALALQYRCIIEAKGNRGSSAVTLRISTLEDLWEGVEKKVDQIVIECARSDFPSMLEQLKKRNIKLQLSRNLSTLGALKKEKMAKEHISPVRKASISFSTEILEKFLNTSHKPDTKATTSVDIQGHSGGLPASQATVNSYKRAREFIAASTEMFSKEKSKMKLNAPNISSILDFESENRRKENEWKTQADAFQQEYARIHADFADATAKLIQSFLKSNQQLFATRI